jgi:calcineurin-like phosphoesterase family protein
MIFFTADQHFYHNNIIKYCNRPFANVEEMNRTLMINWNNKVGQKDIVYILGDLSFKYSDEMLDKLNGQKILVTGDHDKNSIIFKDKFLRIEKLLKIEEQGQTIVLCHYCMRVWPKSHFNSWHLFGHSHGHLEPIGKSWDVGVDKNNFTPLSFDEIKAIMDKRPDNFNLVKPNEKRDVDVDRIAADAGPEI